MFYSVEKQYIKTDTMVYHLWLVKTQQFLPCSNGNTLQKTACLLTIAQSKFKLAVQVFAKSPTSITATSLWVDSVSWFVWCGHHIMSSCVYLPTGVQSTSLFLLECNLSYWIWLPRDISICSHSLSFNSCASIALIISKCSRLPETQQNIYSSTWHHKLKSTCTLS